MTQKLKSPVRDAVWVPLRIPDQGDGDQWHILEPPRQALACVLDDHFAEWQARVVSVSATAMPSLPRVAR